jgi:soluble lytic murein transglycosylase-like protein
MTLVDVMSRVQSLRTQLGLDQTGAAGAGGADFANALDSVRSSNGTGAASATGATGDAVVADARKYLGIKYVYGSTDPAKGLDCSSLVQLAYKDLGVKLPRIAADQARQGTAVPSLAQAKPGDLVAFGSPVDHIGIYIGNHKMIVAPHTGDVVKIQDVYTTPTAIRRILPDSTAGVNSMLPALRPSSLPATGTSALGVPYGDLFTSAAQRYGIDPALLAGVAKVESGYNARAVSPAGAQGLMQLMPGTARGLGVDPLDPRQAIDGAARLLKRNLDEFGSIPLALAAYNAGGGAVHRYGGIPPFAETRAYVPKVQAAMAALQG